MNWLNSLATVLLFPICDHARPWFRFSTRTSSVAELAFCLVASTRATLVICSVLLFVLLIVSMLSVDSGWRVFDRCWQISMEGPITVLRCSHNAKLWLALPWKSVSICQKRASRYQHSTYTIYRTNNRTEQITRVALVKATKQKANSATDEVGVENRNHGLAWSQIGNNRTVARLLS